MITRSSREQLQDAQVFLECVCGVDFLLRDWGSTVLLRPHFCLPLRSLVFLPFSCPFFTFLFLSLLPFCFYLSLLLPLSYSPSSYLLLSPPPPSTYPSSSFPFLPLLPLPLPYALTSLWLPTRDVIFMLGRLFYQQMDKEDYLGSLGGRSGSFGLSWVTSRYKRCIYFSLV